MKLLVTGGAGFIGSNFILYWMKNHPDDKIVNLDALTYAGNLENLVRVQNNHNYSFVKGDIIDAEVVYKTMEGVDWVVHFAAESHVDRSISDPEVFLKSNILGTHVLLESALKSKVARFHHVSTDEVYGSLEIDDTRKFDESSLYDPRSPYSASKAGSDHLVRAYFHTYQLPITITNCSNNYGPYQHPEKLIPLTITNLSESKKVPVYGDGLNVRDWLYVEDHASAIDVVLRDGKVGETYCVGGMDQDISNIDIVKKIIALMNADESSIEFVEDRKGHDRRYAVDWSKIKNELGWAPKNDLDTYLETTIDWYKSNVDWWKHVKSGEYKEYYEKQYKRT